MLNLTTEQSAAIGLPHVMRRLFVFFDALDLDGVTPAPAGFWDDVGTVEVLGRVYYGSGGLIGVGDLSAVSDMTIPGIDITLSELPDKVLALVRGSTIKRRSVEVHFGVFDTDTRELIGPLHRRFKGKVDDADIKTARAGGTGSVIIPCESISAELALPRYDTRSKASASERDAVDGTYDYTAQQAEKRLDFGRSAPR